jgi:hypothetical protein
MPCVKAGPIRHSAADFDIATPSEGDPNPMREFVAMSAFGGKADFGLACADVAV